MSKIYSLDGKEAGNIQLPEVFKAEFRPDLIQRAVVSAEANKRQPYSVKKRAGLGTSADYFGRRRDTYRQTINRGQSRLPREKTGGGGLGKVRRVPQSVGGRRSHPPLGQDFTKKINNKEYLLAIKSAIAATADPELIKGRGHSIEKIKEFPLVVEDSFEKLNKTREVKKTLDVLGLDDDLARAEEKSIRAGRGKMRGRKYKKRKSVLIVVNEDSGIKSGARNIPGVDIARVDELNIELLAPGTHAGRLTLWTKGAINNVEKAITENGSK